MTTKVSALDEAIKSLLIAHCGVFPGHKTVYDWIMETRLDELLPLGAIDNAISVGCGYVITRDGGKVSGSRPLSAQ